MLTEGQSTGKPTKRKNGNNLNKKEDNNKNIETFVNKEIEKEYLEFIDPVYDEKNKEILYYRKIKFQDKKFTLFTKKSEILKYNNLYYYCINHRTSKTSTDLDKKGVKKRICICNSKIEYEKNNNKYIFCKLNSKDCDDLVKEKYMNFREIKKEINNYEEFKNELLNYLKEYPVISYNDFKIYGKDLYNKSEFEFEINNNFYSNIYYNWRKTSNVFTKYSIFDNQLTIDNKQYLRDYTLTMLYNKNNISLFNHEHLIYVSDYFIKKLSQSKHWYIDGTFVYPKGFSQLIVILYY